MASVISQVENNTRIMKGSFLKLNVLATTAPAIVGIWVYMNTKGMITAPVDSDDFNEGPTTEDNAQLREKTIFYGHFPLSTSEFRSIKIPLWSRRNNYLTDPSTTLVVVVHNKNTTPSIQFQGYGRIRTLEG